MNNPTSGFLDIDLSRQDIQALSSADAVAAFFARLGYDTDARTAQTAGNLGITADSTARPVKKIELIADQEGLLQVYLFEMQSVTVAHTRALARAFRNRAGNYLLILTSDYDRLDFILLEKYLPVDGADASSLGQRQVGIRPRILTIERLKPGPVHLRVLRRLTWTEADPFGQYDKLLSAYALADWSEDYFNNRALFSDYYLKERLPGFPIWTDDPKPSFLRLRELYQRAASRFAGKERKNLSQELVEPVLRVLGFEARPGKPSPSASAEPHYRLYSAERKDALLALCQVYPWDRSLDGKDDRRDKETQEENPGAIVVSLLEKGESPWVVVTNGRLWRLYAKRTHARATNYYEIDLDEVLSQAGPHAPEINESFRYFWLLFRSQAFKLQEIDREGKKQSLSLLDQLLLYSDEYAKELGERLKERVFEDIFPHLAAGFIAFIRQRDGAHADISQETLNTLYQGTLTLLYRLLFLLYAESRDLLPVKEVRGYFEASLTKLKQEVAETAGNIEDEVEEKFKKHYREDDYRLYDRLMRLCRIVDKGDATLNVPVYNGGLFLSEPEEMDDSFEADAGRFLNRNKVPDRYLALAIDLLARDEDRKRHDLVFIDFKSLGVRQLGSIYEGLLEFKLRIAERKLAIVKEKGREIYMDFSKLEEKIRERADRQDRIKRKGQVYLENDKHERKATGSYYTPDHIVKYIVEHAVGPVLKEKFEGMRPKLREAQQKRRAFFDKQEALRKQGLRTEPESKAEFIGQELVDELFNIKVLDQAMGSGHFLVETVDYITDKTLDFLNAFPWNPVLAHLSRMRETILQEMDEQGITIDPKRLTDVNLLKRHVLKRCIYGVDINPMAVELAKVSLWLDCFTLGAPLSFLDHHLRCGNSLIGVTVEEVDKIRAEKGQLLLSASSDWQGMLQAIQAMIEVGGLPDVTSAQVARSRSTYKSALSNLENFKKILDVHTARWFVEPPKGKANGKKTKAKEDPFDYILKSGDLFEWSHGKKAPLLDVEPYRSLLSDCARVAKEKRFFHWELEFPEVFYGPRPGTIQAIERLKEGGFDALIGNPPWGGLRTLGDLEDFLKSNYATAGKAADWFAFFLENALKLVTTGGNVGQVIPGGWQTSVESRDLRKIVAEKMQIQRFVNLPYDVFPEAYTEAVIMTGRVVTDTEPAWRSATPSILICDRRERLSEISDADARWFTVACADWFKIEPSNFPFFTFWTREVLALGERILQMSFTLGSLADVQRGITPFFPTNREPSKRFAPALDGELLRYTYDFTGMQCVEYHEGIAEYKEPKYFREERAIVRQLISRQFRIQAVLTSEEFVVNQSHQIVLLTTPSYSTGYVVSLLDSRLLSFLHVQGSALALRDDFPKLVLDDTRKLPIRRIEFTTPQAQRQEQLRQLTNNYRAALEYVPEGGTKSDVYREVFASVVRHIGPACPPSDVMHDFLAYLAEQMMDLNKQKQTEAKRFLNWLETALKIQPDKNGKSGIECLTGKTIIQDYLGDYQRREEHAPFDSLWQVVQKNSRRLSCSLTGAFQEQLRREHEKSLSVLLPIKHKLAATDWLVDQLVYRLYGLTQQEIDLVEGGIKTN